MRLKSLKNLTLGKTKEKPDEGGDESKAAAKDRITNMEKEINGRTKDLEEKVQQIQELSPESDAAEPNGDTPEGPHGPLKELTLENNDNLDEENLDDDNLDDENSLPGVLEVAKSDVDEDGEGVKLVEVSAATVAPQKDKEESPTAEASAISDTPVKEGEAQEAQPVEASAESAKTPEKEEEIKPDENSDSLNELFDDEEEEENPLANLIKSLPDVTAQEIIDDLNEIKGIIKEWQKK